MEQPGHLYLDRFALHSSHTWATVGFGFAEPASPPPSIFSSTLTDAEVWGGTLGFMTKRAYGVVLEDNCSINTLFYQDSGVTQFWFFFSHKWCLYFEPKNEE